MAYSIALISYLLLLAKIKLFPLKENNYTPNFIMALAMAIHLKLIEPAELTYLQDSGKTLDYVEKLLLKRITDNKVNR